MNIFKELKERKVMYSVCISELVPGTGYDHFIACALKDRKKLEGLYFRKFSEDSDVIIRSMGKNMISDFRKNKGLFELKHESSCGRVYEPIGQNFKVYLRGYNLEL